MEQENRRGHSSIPPPIRNYESVNLDRAIELRAALCVSFPSSRSKCPVAVPFEEAPAGRGHFRAENGSQVDELTRILLLHLTQAATLVQPP